MKPSSACQRRMGSVPQETHYGLDDWLAFVRGTGEPAQIAAMQQHLKTGCTKCARAVWLWGKVLRDQTTHERQSRPPDTLVRLVLGAEKDLAIAASNMARVLFDSLRHPSPAGVRGTGFAPRQVLATGEDLMIDLHVQFVTRGKYSLTGQVYRASYTPEFAGDLSVSLMKDDLLVGHTYTNSLGEFHIECDSFLEEGYSLAIVDQGKQVVVPLAAPKAA